jgi:hypothetical protein
VRQLRDHGQVVRDEEIRQAEFALELSQQVQNLSLDGDVERRHRLVEQDQVGFERERAGDGDALALAARQLGRPPVERVLVHELEPASRRPRRPPVLARYLRALEEHRALGG